ncbi:uncharacterized protein JN550_010979 [Neoarthrinium moseri]|uniref:uncharacterized protein n=1 Tax=Neoarthrinium moseri TaxID=1658444 RepID=UPI001FDDCABF|nr:uncharacterized protein JN550_010979 [Neoarthrinium moseri]KAI1861300.1 hypothetical protein JN550_010979 [Neoarthrinium moseri]
MTQNIPASGVWAPAPTFLNPETDNLDLEAQAAFYSYLSRTGLAGLVILGTNAEAFLMTREERKVLVSTARTAVGPGFPLMVGVGSHSTKQVLELIADATEAGATFVLVLPPAYFGKATTPEVIERFFDEVAKNSTLPIVLTCGSVAKIARLSGALSNFATFGGQSDFIIGGLSSGSAGCVAAFANIFPKTILRIYDLYRQGKYDEAFKLHRIAALAEQYIKEGVSATKYAVAIRSAAAAGIVDAVTKLQPRHPYVAPSDTAKTAIREGTKEIAKIEDSLPLSA